MDLVISDSSTLIHLAAISRLGLLRELFQRITVPPPVWKSSSRERVDLVQSDARRIADLYGLSKTGVVGLLIRARKITPIVQEMCQSVRCSVTRGEKTPRSDEGTVDLGRSAE